MIINVDRVSIILLDASCYSARVSDQYGGKYVNISTIAKHKEAVFVDTIRRSFTDNRHQITEVGFFSTKAGDSSSISQNYTFIPEL